MPIGHAMLAAAIVYLFLTGQDIGLVASQSLNGLFSKFVLMAVPLFIFSAEIMNDSAVTDRLFEFANLLVGRFRGGLAHVNIVASIIFSGMSGSALADAAGPGKLEVDMMVKAGYSPGFSARAQHDLGDHRADHPALDPDGALRRRLQHLDRLSVHGRRHPRPAAGPRADGRGRLAIAQAAQFPDRAAADAARRRCAHRRTRCPALLLPAIMLGGIYSGAVTPTEAAAVAAFYRAAPRLLLVPLAELRRLRQGAGRIRRARPASSPSPSPARW